MAAVQFEADSLAIEAEGRVKLETVKTTDTQQSQESSGNAWVVGSDMGMPPTGLSEVGAGGKDFFAVLQQNLQAQAATALIQSVVNGADLKDSLQQALISALINTVGAKVAQSTATGLGLAAPTGFSGAGTVGVEAFNAYRHAAAGYSLLAGAGTGAVVGGGTYLGGLLLGPTSNEGGYLTDVTSRFSAVQLGTSMAIGAATGMYSTSMLGWAGVPNSVMNLTTAPGIVIRANAFGISKAAEAATADFQGKE